MIFQGCFKEKDSRVPWGIISSEFCCDDLCCCLGHYIQYLCFQLKVSWPHCTLTGLVYPPGDVSCPEAASSL